MTAPAASPKLRPGKLPAGKTARPSSVNSSPMPDQSAASAQRAYSTSTSLIWARSMSQRSCACGSFGGVCIDALPSRSVGVVLDAHVSVTHHGRLDFHHLLGVAELVDAEQRRRWHVVVEPLRHAGPRIAPRVS